MVPHLKNIRELPHNFLPNQLGNQTHLIKNTSIPITPNMPHYNSTLQGP